MIGDSPDSKLDYQFVRWIDHERDLGRKVVDLEIKIVLAAFNFAPGLMTKIETDPLFGEADVQRLDRQFLQQYDFMGRLLPLPAGAT